MIAFEVIFGRSFPSFTNYSAYKYFFILDVSKNVLKIKDL